MRLNMYDQFVVGVVWPSGGWSKGRPIAYLEEEDRCVPLFHLLIPNELDDEEVARFVGEKFGAFAQPHKQIAVLKETTVSEYLSRNGPPRRRGVAQPHAHSSVQR
jgi:hypothetical protein